MTDETLISRQDAIDTLFEILDKPKHAEFLYGDEIYRALMTLPPVQPKKGKWMRESIKGILYHCSVCTGRFDYEWKFCPNCGADMRGASK